MNSNQKHGSPLERESIAGDAFYIKRRGFWDGFWDGFFPSFVAPSIRSNLGYILERRDGFQEDQRRIGRDMRVAMGLYAKQTEESEH